MKALRSVGARLSLALAVVVAGALAVVWIALVPTLERRLVNAKLGQLRHAAEGARADFKTSAADPDFATSAANAANARVVVFGPLNATTAVPIEDSLQGSNAPDVTADPLAQRAFVSGSSRPVSGTVVRNDERYAEAAIATPSGDVILLTASLHDTLADVALVQQRLIFGGLLALGVSIAIGFSASAAFARRIRRLERAADRIAAGDFAEPIVDEGGDELGELAAAFDRMRLRLAQLDDARRAFIANASHELRTPIFSLGGFLELLQDEELDEPTRAEFLATMAEQVQRLTKLATDLLDLSRLDAGRMRIEQEAVPLAELARDLADEFAAVAQATGHSLEAPDDASEDVVALGDRERVLQIGRILVDNALAHTPAGTSVEIRARRDGGSAELAVADDGPGIPDAAREQVFERFTRLAGGRASGSGLGLAIARELAELMRGVVRLESAPGRTVFTLALPATVAEREPVPG